MDAFTYIAQLRIEKAIEEGQFDNLPGSGKPLRRRFDKEDVFAEFTARMMQEAGVLPAELTYRRQIEHIKSQLRTADETRRCELLKDLEDIELRQNMARDERMRQAKY